MTRNFDDYQLTKNKTKFSSKDVRSVGPEHWNKINSDVKKSKTSNTFKINPSSPKGGCNNPPNSFRPGAQNRAAKG